MRFVPTSRVRGFWSSARRAVSASRRLAKQAATAVAPIESLEPRALLSSYYVSTSGNDSNTGTLSQPFRTIQAAAERAEPGDTVYIRGGTYRETVRPSRSGKSGDPIVFAAYGNERVTVSGADVIGGWSNHDDKVYRARQSWDLGFGNNQMLCADPATAEIRRFLVGPNLCEITGVFVTPDERTMFVGIQHPGETPDDSPTDPAKTKDLSSWPDGDAGGRPRSACIVITKDDGGKIGS